MSPVPTEPCSLTAGYAPASSASHRAVTTVGRRPAPPTEAPVRADREHRAHLALGQLVADRASVAAQQAQAVVGGGLGGHVLAAVGADAGGAAVDPAPGGDLPRSVPGPVHAVHGVRAGDRAGARMGEADHVGDREAVAVEHDDRL